MAHASKFSFSDVLEADTQEKELILSRLSQQQGFHEIAKRMRTISAFRLLASIQLKNFIASGILLIFCWLLATVLRIGRQRIRATATEAPDAERRDETATFVFDTNKKDLERDNNMADVRRGLQVSLTKVATASEKQTVASEKQAAAIESLRDDIFLNTVDPTVEDDENVGRKYRFARHQQHFGQSTRNDFRCRKRKRNVAGLCCT